MTYILVIRPGQLFQGNLGVLGAAFLPWRVLSQWRTERDQKFHFWDREKFLMGAQAQTYMTSLVGL